jgi:hypothetical protein
MTASDMFYPPILICLKRKTRSTYTAYLICFFCLIFSTACSSISSYHHQSLDSPSRHVDNGMKLLQVNKIDAAIIEFSRANELDPDFAPAYTGLGLAYGRIGNFIKGYEFIELAQKNARGYEQESAVKEARFQLDTLKKNM